MCVSVCVSVCVCLCVCVRVSVCVSVCMSVCVLSHVQLFATSWTVAHQAPLHMEFSRREHWTGLLFPPPGDLPDPGTEPTAPACVSCIGMWILHHLSHLLTK